MSNDKIRLFCIPGGGASAYVFLKYTKFLKKDIKLCLLEIPGRGLRKNEKPISDLKMVVDDLYHHMVEELKKDPDSNYMLLGYCYGGFIAYELYRKICREGIKEPFHIFMSATDVVDGELPLLFSNENAREEIQDLFTAYFPEHVFRDKEMVIKIANRYVDCLYQQYRNSEMIGMVSYDDIFREEREGYKLEQLSADKRFEVEKCLEYASETIKVIEADLRNVYEYKKVKRKYTNLECDLTIFAGVEDMLTPIDSVKGWIRFAAKDFHLYSMPGGHRILLDNYEQCMHVINKVVRDFWDVENDDFL